uniref:Uncharacterized protein n=1 Tax=Gasterosteus aculeatus TaxID=69293 RepID=G3NER5_GASAC
ERAQRNARFDPPPPPSVPVDNHCLTETNRSIEYKCVPAVKTAVQNGSWCRDIRSPPSWLMRRIATRLSIKVNMSNSPQISGSNYCLQAGGQTHKHVSQRSV